MWQSVIKIVVGRQLLVANRRSALGNLSVFFLTPAHEPEINSMPPAAPAWQRLGSSPDDIPE